jgi:signal transduction histidine kinase
MRRRLALLVAGTTSVVVIASLAPLWLLVRVLAEDRAVSTARQEADAVAVVTAVVQDRDQLDPVVQLVNERSSRRTTVFLPDGQVAGAPAARTESVQLAARGQAFTTATDNGREILLPVVTPAGLAIVRTFVPEALLHQGVNRAHAMLVALGLGLLLVSLLAADLLARRVVRPLGRLADTAHQLTDGQLDARATPGGPPEVVELATALNRLAQRIGELLAAEREMVADLSHRLRTPITALWLDSEALSHPGEASRLAAHVQALERTVDDIIREARRPIREGVRPAADIVAVVSDRVAFWSVLAEEQGRSVSLRLPRRPLRVRVAPVDLTAAVDALLENVFAHTPEGAGMWIQVTDLPEGGASLLVEDNGPGLPRASVDARGESDAGSTGLGLDIVRRTAEASGGRLVLGNTGWGGGASVCVELGPEAS